jgi:hypothetical protein
MPLGLNLCLRAPNENPIVVERIEDEDELRKSPTFADQNKAILEALNHTISTSAALPHVAAAQ